MCFVHHTKFQVGKFLRNVFYSAVMYYNILYDILLFYAILYCSIL